MGVSSAAGLPRGYLLWQARACMCNVSSSHGHIIYLFTHLSLSPLERAHTAEVLGDSGAITVYWSEGMRSYFLTIPHAFTYHLLRTLAHCTCVSVREKSRTFAASRLFWTARPRLVIRGWCVLSGKWHARSWGICFGRAAHACAT
jgi:hypothetical protein